MKKFDTFYENGSIYSSINVVYILEVWFTFLVTLYEQRRSFQENLCGLWFSEKKNKKKRNKFLLKWGNVRISQVSAQLNLQPAAHWHSNSFREFTRHLQVNVFLTSFWHDDPEIPAHYSAFLLLYILSRRGVRIKSTSSLSLTKTSTVVSTEPRCFQ